MKEVVHSVGWKAAEHDGACHGAPSETKPWCNHDAHWVVKPKWRANFIPAPHFFELNHCCHLVNDALGGKRSVGHCYLVGSSRQRRDFRDVDIRFIMDDAEYDRMFRGPGPGWLNAYWSLLCQSISAWMSAHTKLPVDFQIQRQTEANRDHPGAGNRDAMGMFLCDYPGEQPKTLGVPEKENA